MNAPAPILALDDFTDLLAGHQEGAEVIMVPLSAIGAAGPVQTRRPFDPEADADDRNLVESVRTHGVLQPVLLGPDDDETVRRYRIIAGHRRVAACRHAGLERVPAIVRSMEEIQAAEIGIIENLQRADLNPLEQAQQYQAFMRISGLGPEELAQRVNVSRRSVYYSLSLLKLPAVLQQAVLEDRLTPSQARACAKAPEERLAQVIEAAAGHRLSTAGIERLVTQTEEAPAEVPVSVLAQDVASARSRGEMRASKRKGQKGREKGGAEEVQVNYRRYTTQLGGERGERLEALATEMRLDTVTVRRAALLLLADRQLVVPSAVAYAQQLAQTEVGRALARIEAGVERMRLAVGGNLTPSQAKAAVLVLAHVKGWADEMIRALEGAPPAVVSGGK
jgi:ParB family chromosome partitioning protein